MKKSSIYISAAALMGVSFALSAAPVLSQAVPTEAAPATAPATQVAPSDAPVPKVFVQDAFQANEFEIAAGQIAVKKAANAKVKAFAKKSLDEKLALRAEMTTAIQSASSDMNFTQDWTADQKAALAELNATSGKAFDAKYVQAVADTLDKTVPQFEDYATRGTDTAIKTFAVSALPKLKDTQAQVQTLLPTAG